MFVRILDGILFFPVAIFTFMVLPLITDNRAIENFCRDVNYLYLFIGIMAVSIGIGVFQKVKGYNQKQYARPAGGILFSIVKAIVIIIAAWLILPHIQGENIKLSRALLLVWLYISAMLLQAAFLGQQSLMGKLLALIWSLVKAILSGILTVLVSLEAFVERVINAIGLRLTTGILELIILIIVSVVVMNIHNGGEYQSDKEYRLSQVVEESAEFLSLDDFDCPTEGIAGSILGMNIGAFTYELLKMLPIIGMLAGELCFFFRVGLVGMASRGVLGRLGFESDIWDFEHPTFLVIKYNDGTTHETNGNPYYILMIIVFILVFGINGLAGIFLPVCVIFNIIVGTVILVIKVIVRKIPDKEEALS